MTGGTAYQLGAARALEEAGLEKTANPALASAGARFLPWLTNLFRGGAAARAAAPAVSAGAKPGFFSNVLKPAVGNMGERFLHGTPNSPGLTQVGTAFQQGIGKGISTLRQTPLARNMIGGSIFTGGINALMAEKGDRLNAFGRGAAWGAAGGAVGTGLGAMGHGLRSTKAVADRIAKGGIKGKLTQFATSPGVLSIAGTWGMPMGNAPKVPEPGLPMTNLPV